MWVPSFTSQPILIPVYDFCVLFCGFCFCLVNSDPSVKEQIRYFPSAFCSHTLLFLLLFMKLCFSPLVYWYSYLLFPSLDFKGLRMRLLLIHLFILTVSKHRTIEQIKTYLVGFLNGSAGNDSACQWRRHRRHEFNPRVEKIPRGGNAAHSRILAGEIHGQRSWVGYSPWGHKVLDMTEQGTMVD